MTPHTQNEAIKGPFTDTSNARVRQHAARHAHYLGEHKGKRVYRFPVTVHLNNSRLCDTIATLEFQVVANSAEDAANSVRDDYKFRAETEIFAYGPKGGMTYRWVGFESAIGAGMWETERDAQLLLATERLGA